MFGITIILIILKNIILFIIVLAITYSYGGKVEEDPNVAINHYYDFVYDYAQSINKNFTIEEEYKYVFNEELFTGSYCYKKFDVTVFEDVLYEYSDYELIRRRKSMMVIRNGANDNAAVRYENGCTDKKRTNPIEINKSEEYMFCIDSLVE